MAAPLPKGWAEYTNEEGAPYFHNADKNETSVRGRPTTWTVLQQDGPNHLGMRGVQSTARRRWRTRRWAVRPFRRPQHGLSSDTMALITSGCGAARSPRIKWP